MRTYEEMIENLADYIEIASKDDDAKIEAIVEGYTMAIATTFKRSKSDVYADAMAIVNA